MIRPLNVTIATHFFNLSFSCTMLLATSSISKKEMDTMKILRSCCLAHHRWSQQRPHQHTTSALERHRKFDGRGAAENHGIFRTPCLRLDGPGPETATVASKFLLTTVLAMHSNIFW